MLYSAVALWGAAATFAQVATAAVAPTPRLYVDPSPFAPSLVAQDQQTPLKLTAPQTNAVLAHHLGVEKVVHWPVSNSHRKAGANANEWQLALGDPLQLDNSPEQRRVVVVLECGKPGCDDVIPLHLNEARPIELPSSVSPTSYLAAMSLHLHRLADQLGLPASEIQGLEELVRKGIKAVTGWQGWVSEELGNWIGWHNVEHDHNDRVHAAVQHELPDNAGLVQELDLLDASAQQLVLDLEHLASLVDSTSRSSSSRHESNDDSAPQGTASSSNRDDSLKQVVVIHLTGLKNVAAKHARSSEVYQRAASLLRDSLTATLAALSAPASPSSDAKHATGATGSKTILLALPEQKTPLLRRKRAWLDAFEEGNPKLVKGVGIVAKRSTDGLGGSSSAAAGGAMNVFSPGSVLRKRQFANANDDDNDDDDDKKEAGKPYLVPSSYQCFASRSDLMNQTASCLDHGVPVKGLTTRTDLPDGGECWVCRCGTTTDEETGKKTKWSGQGCEKVDLSSDFALLSLTAIGLIATVALSVGILYSIGSQQLPGTLGAVGGDGGRLKRD